MGLDHEPPKDEDFSFEFGDGLSGRRGVSELLFKFLLLFGVEVIIIFGCGFDCLRFELLPSGQQAFFP